MRTRRATNCAIAPWLVSGPTEENFSRWGREIPNRLVEMGKCGSGGFGGGWGEVEAGGGGGFGEDGIEHGGGEAAGEGVLLADVVAAEQFEAVAAGAGGFDRVVDAVAEFGAGAGDLPAGRGEGGHQCLPAPGAEDDDGTDCGGEQFEFVDQPVPAAVAFVDGGFVVRGRAVHGGGDAGADQQ